MKAIIFGINGQDGFYLKRLLLSLGHDVIGISRSVGEWTIGDISDYQFVKKIIEDNQPDYIFHLAANSTTRHDALFDNIKAIEQGTWNILEACYQVSRDAKIFLSGSAVQFQNNGVPINENSQFSPISPYAVSRISSTYAGRYYRSKGLKVYVGYFFNHDSPRRTERHLNQRIILSVLEIVNGTKESLAIGNLDARKEFNFAGDIVEAIWILVNQDEHFEAVLGSGVAHSVRDWIELVFDLSGLRWQEHVVQNKQFVSEYSILESDPSLIKSLGWEPQVDIGELALMMYNHQINQGKE